MELSTFLPNIKQDTNNMHSGNKRRKLFTLTLLILILLISIINFLKSITKGLDETFLNSIVGKILNRTKIGRYLFTVLLFTKTTTKSSMHAF